MLPRTAEQARVTSLLRAFRVVAIVGARQVGKTTLARRIASKRSSPTTYLDLERPRDLARLDDLSLAERTLSGLVILDEVQRRPDVFPLLRVLADEPRGPRFLVLGSAAPELLRQASESLAGRIAYHRLGGLAIDEVGARNLELLWLRGGFPRSYTARSHAASLAWRREFVQSFLERDLPQLGFRTAAATLRRFWSMLAHVHGQILNYSELGRSIDATDMTVRHYADLLEQTFMVCTLRPWHENIAKRQVKAPKLYFRDTGLLHVLLDIADVEDLISHPKAGASWEGFCLEQVRKRLGARFEQCYFWATHAGAELDLLVLDGRRRLGFEMKYTAAPRVTPSMTTALKDLGLDSLDVLHAGEETFLLAPKIRALALRRIQQDLTPLAGRTRR